MENMADRLLEAIDKKGNPCVVGLDPVLDRIPKHLIEGYGFGQIAEAIKRFNEELIDAVADIVPAVKPQIAFYEKYGHYGLEAFQHTVNYAKLCKDLIVIEDGKRNDIGSTSRAYADGHLGVVRKNHGPFPSIDVDLLTVNPFLGTDGLDPFVDVCKTYKKGLFILVKTSNPSSGQIQDRRVKLTPNEKNWLSCFGVDGDTTELYNLTAMMVDRYAQDTKGKRGYSSIGAVVGATYPEQAEILRKLMPDSIFLVPGYGAQGASADDITNCFNDDGYGAVVNASRSIIYAYEKHDDPKNFANHARDATEKMVEDVNDAIMKAGKTSRIQDITYQ